MISQFYKLQLKQGGANECTTFLSSFKHGDNLTKLGVFIPANNNIDVIKGVFCVVFI